MSQLDDLLETMIPDDDEQSLWFRGMLYGAEGAGKTVAACSVGERVLYVEADPEGWVSLMNHPDILFLPDGKKRVTRMQYEGLSQLTALAEEGNGPAFEQFDTFVFDTASQIINNDLDTLTEVRHKMGKMDEEVPDWPTYRINRDRARRAFTKLMKETEKNIVLISHAKLGKDKDGIERWQPDMPQAIRNDLTRMCHLVGFMTAKVAQGPDDVIYNRVMQVHPTALIIAKSRIGGLPVKIQDPDMHELVQSWRESGSNTVDESSFAPESEAVISKNAANNQSPELEI